jgi:hypothetical protein
LQSCTRRFDLLLKQSVLGSQGWFFFSFFSSQKLKNKLVDFEFSGKKLAAGKWQDPIPIRMK